MTNIKVYTQNFLSLNLEAPRIHFIYYIATNRVSFETKKQNLFDFQMSTSNPKICILFAKQVMHFYILYSYE